jgi:hypothetical protein
MLLVTSTLMDHPGKMISKYSGEISTLVRTTTNDCGQESIKKKPG